MQNCFGGRQCPTVISHYRLLHKTSSSASMPLGVTVGVQFRREPGLMRASPLRRFPCVSPSREVGTVLPFLAAHENSACEDAI